MRGFAQGVIESLGEVENGVARLDQRLVRPVTPGMYLSDFQALPGLVGFWPMSSVQRSTGNVYDLSGQARTLTYNGNPTFNQYTGGGLALPYCDYDGTGDFHSRADETDLDVLGTEAIYAAAVRGLTVGGWFWPNAVASTQVMICKNNPTGNQRAYSNRFNSATGFWGGHISTDGINTVSVESTITTVAARWYCWIFRFIPSTEIAAFENGVFYRNTTAIPASIFNSTADLRIGANGDGASLLAGRASFCFLCAQALPDAWLDWLWTRGRVLFGV